MTPVLHDYVSSAPPVSGKVDSTEWNRAHDVSITNADVAAGAAIDESKLALTNPTHAAVTLDANADTLLSLSTQELGLDTQLANLVFAGAATGGAAVPAFRALVAADIPSLSYQPVDADLTSIAALGFASTSFLKKTAADTWALDTNAYAGLTLANVFMAAQTINVNSTTALLVEQDGVKDNVLVVDTTNGRVSVGTTQASRFSVTGETDIIQLIIKANATQTTNLQEWQNSSAGVLAKITPTGGALFSDKVQFTQTDGNEYIDSLADGDLDLGATTAINLRSDAVFIGAGTGLPYGACYISDMVTPFTQASAVQNTWYLISDVEVVDGPLNLMTHDGNGKLTATKAGTYKIDWSAVCDVSVANKHLQMGISIDGAAPTMFQHIDPQAGLADTSVSGTRIITLTANQTIELAIRTTSTGAPDITCDHLSITVVMIGG